ncbi:autotransporter outer membrane beta-barrel domain-containing protein [Paraburkholderia sp. MMS20-SJTN17]|uniref:Autotransporter outer membrane beta-barrel domain-containing protein n=1 Tax=Paraburkholderia translucens TaxID=2886945 RepID=A0ABS8KMA5_9BURK|nr:autotransporter outer membrane beta-barrel domain-containing protein [Paraburkholderia sp. MMS20-SJTN17]MCC8405593.1 autotransporter outer membrane beta-barrel domain-containing protein [Paraburkholderia sp. MMS20-SJTN17]
MLSAPCRTTDPTLAAYLESGLSLPLASGTWLFHAGMRAGHYMQPGFAEHDGGGIDLSYAAANSNAGPISGARSTGGWGVAWEHRFGSASQSFAAAFVNAPDATWQVFGSPTSRDTARLTLGANWRRTRLSTFYVRFAADEGAREHDHGVLAEAQGEMVSQV